jgi:hypothetical protein
LTRADRPAGYSLARADVAWEPRFLQLDTAPAVHEFAEFGTVPDDVLLSPVAITDPFRLLSEEGARVAVEIARELESLAVADVRSKRMRGCTYRSRFFAGMYSDPALLSYLSDLAQADLRPHPIGHHRVQLNFVPEDLGRAVDVWHYDVVSFDIVMLLTEPSLMKGGNTEYFLGTVEEGEAILRQGGRLPAERIVQVAYPGAGWGFLQQGHQVLHRAAPLDEPYPRVSLVASYYCADSRFREPTILPPLRVADGRDVALLEWANYAAYRTVAKLQRFLEDQPDFGLEPAEVRDRLQACIAEAEVAIAEFDSLDEGHLINLG